MRSRWLCVGCLFTASLGLCVAGGEPTALGSAQTKAQAKAQKEVFLNANGEPKGFHAGDTERYAVWHAKGSWHVRTTTARHEHHFTGRIRVEGGVFTGVESHDLEQKGRFRDWWRVSDDMTEIVINFKTDREIDGINFQVSPDAKLLHFNLHIDGKHHKHLIFIGREGLHPEGDPFRLRAHPGKK